jgi:3-oxoacyl-[acyl-carrier protein] reductase
MSRLAAKSALVIGGARGIGAAIAKRFAEEGARVTIADRLAAEGVATAARFGGAFIATDIARPTDAEAAVAAALAAHGRLDI